MRVRQTGDVGSRRDLRRACRAERLYRKGCSGQGHDHQCKEEHRAENEEDKTSVSAGDHVWIASEERVRKRMRIPVSIISRAIGLFSVKSEVRNGCGSMRLSTSRRSLTQHFGIPTSDAHQRFLSDSVSHAHSSSISATRSAVYSRVHLR